MKKLIGICLLAMLVVGAAALPSEAATYKGTLSKPKQLIKWTGTLIVSTATQRCQGAADQFCDHFKVKVNMGEGAKFRISIPTPTPVDDIDFQVFDPNGGEIALAAGELPGMDETAEIIHKKKFRNKTYDIAVNPFLIHPGTIYNGTIKVTKYVK